MNAATRTVQSAKERQRSIGYTLRPLAIALWLVATNTQAQNPEIARPQPPDPHVITPRLTDASIPVITMEQSGLHTQVRLQGYRIQIYKDGTVVYHGLNRVRILGEVKSYIRPEQVEKIQTEFAKYKFWQVPDAYSRWSGPGWVFTLRDGEKKKTLYRTGDGISMIYLKIIEDVVKSSQWRCPFDDIDGRERCSDFDQATPELIETFLTRELPRFLETYK